MDRNDDRRCLPERVVRHIRHDRACGLSLAKVARLHGVCVNTVRRLCDENCMGVMRDYTREAARRAKKVFAKDMTDEQLKEARRVRNERQKKYRDHLKGVQKCRKRKTK